MKKPIILLLCWFFPLSLFSATYYVSASATNGTGSIGDPWTPSQAFTNAVAGDTVYFRGGTYNIPAKNTGDTYRGYYEPSNSGTGDSDENRIIFSAYTGETPIFNGTAGGSGDVEWYETIIGTENKDYITISGITFQCNNGTHMPRIFIGHDDNSNVSTGIKVINCTFNGGTEETNIQPTGANVECIRIENANTATIQGCTIYSVQDQTDNENCSGIKIYSSVNVIMKNNEIYDCRRGIYVKNNVDTADVSYNFVHDCYEGIYFNPDGGSDVMPDVSIYHNLVINCEYASINFYGPAANTGNGLKIYNNTIYSPTTSGNYALYAAGTCTEMSDGMSVYNNIILGTAYKLTLPPSVLTEVDYNQYGNSGTFNVRDRYNCPGTTYTSLANWKASTVINGGGHPDTHGLSSDPSFVNASGNYNTIADFALQEGSPCDGAGKGGVDVGADVSLVGADAGTTSALQPTMQGCSLQGGGN